MAALPEGQSSTHIEAFISGTDKLIIDHESETRAVYDLQADPAESRELPSDDPRTKAIEDAFAAFVKARSFSSAD